MSCTESELEKRSTLVFTTRCRKRWGQFNGKTNQYEINKYRYTTGCRQQISINLEEIQKLIAPLFQTTFHYDAHYWKNHDKVNLFGGETGFDEQESKLPTYWNTSFSKICLGMKINKHHKFIVINRLADSLHSLIADDQYRNTSLGRDEWKALIGSNASLQHNCNREGFNVFSGRRDRSKVRIGIISNDQNDCYSCNSLIGFGTGSQHNNVESCGNEARHIGLDNGQKSIKAMGYILVQ